MPKYVYMRLPHPLPVGTVIPNGYVAEGTPRTVRNAGTFMMYKKEVIVVNKDVMDELAGLFGNIQVTSDQQDGVAVAIANEDELQQLFGNLTMGGKRKSRKMRRYKRRI